MWTPTSESPLCHLLLSLLIDLKKHSEASLGLFVG